MFIILTNMLDEIP